jgi:glycine/D-amino acid oxidase-like deaminating enzyme
MISDRQNLVVVGAGIAGLATAYFYKRWFPERDVLVVEQNGQGRGNVLRSVGRGLSGRSGGHRMPGFEADHSQVVELLGERAALDLYRETVAFRSSRMKSSQKKRSRAVHGAAIGS